MTCYKPTGGCGVYEMYSCSECPYSKPPKKKNTWYEKIQNMTIEELAVFLDEYEYMCNPMYCAPDDCPYTRGQACTTTINFLKSEVNDNG